MMTTLLERYLAIDPMEHYAKLHVVRNLDPELAVYMSRVLERLLPKTIDLEAKRRAREAQDHGGSSG